MRAKRALKQIQLVAYDLKQLQLAPSSKFCIYFLFNILEDTYELEVDLQTFKINNNSDFQHSSNNNLNSKQNSYNIFKITSFLHGSTCDQLDHPRVFDEQPRDEFARLT
jgi:hypothetical protein